MLESDINWRKKYRDQQPDANLGRTVSCLSQMPRGIDEVLAHLFIEPKTLDQLNRAMVTDRTFEQQRQGRSTALVEYGVPVEYGVEYTLLYDVGHLAVASIIESDGGVLKVCVHAREGVRVFLRAAFMHHHESSPRFRNALNAAIRDEQF